MVNAYKRWTDAELLDNALQIKHLVKLAWAEMSAKAKPGDHYHAKYINQITQSEYTLEVLRQEWRRRKAKTNQL